jgi:transcriptional regulator with XRE-family HTH domain
VNVIGQNIRKLRESRGESQSAFAARFSLTRGQIASYEADEKPSEPALETVLAIADFFDIDIKQFVSDPTFDGKPLRKVEQAGKLQKVSSGISKAASNDALFAPYKTEIIVATPDIGGNRTVPIVNRKAAGSYLTGYQTQEYFEELDAMTIPAYMLRGAGQGLIIQAVNDSMEDTIFDGDYLVCRLIERANWIEINDFTVCVVVTESRGIQVKRVKNRLNSDRLLRLSSDNRRYPSFNVFVDDIHQIWQVVFLLTTNLPNRNDTLYRKMDSLEDTTTDLREMYEQLRTEIDQIQEGR